MELPIKLLAISLSQQAGKWLVISTLEGESLVILCGLVSGISNRPYTGLSN